MEYLSSDKILIVDLAAGEISEDELSEDLVAEKIGGAAVNKALYEQHADGDPIVIGTGLLSGTLCPGSSLAVLTGKSPITGKLAHAPITFHVGIELKYAGFDYVVLKGKADKPVFLWIHDGVADVNDASDVWGSDVWQSTDAWRKALGDDLIQTMVIGPAGESGSDAAQVCLNYWPSGDRFGFGRLFGEKNLKGIALRGMGLLEIADAEGFVDKCLEIIPQVKDGALKGKKGVEDICAAMGHADVKEWLAPIVHRHTASYNSPYPTQTFVFLDEDPALKTESAVAEPGFRLDDPDAVLGFKNLGLEAKEACRLMCLCARKGLSAAAVAQLSEKAGKKSAQEIEASLDSLTGTVELAGQGIFSPWCPRSPLFGDFGASDAASWWERRQAVAYVFGIDPMFAVMSPELTEELLLELAGIGTEIEFTSDTLESVVSDLQV